MQSSETITDKKWCQIKQILWWLWNCLLSWRHCSMFAKPKSICLLTAENDKDCLLQWIIKFMAFCLASKNVTLNWTKSNNASNINCFLLPTKSSYNPITLQPLCSTCSLSVGTHAQPDHLFTISHVSALKITDRSFWHASMSSLEWNSRIFSLTSSV